MRINTNRRNPGAVVRHIVQRLESASGRTARGATPPQAGLAQAAHRPEPSTHHRGAAEPRGAGPSSGGAQ